MDLSAWRPLNLLGTFQFAFFVARTDVFPAEVRQALAAIIALTVWLLPGAESFQVAIITILNYLVGLGNFNHIVAGSTMLFHLVSMRALSWDSYSFFLRSNFAGKYHCRSFRSGGAGSCAGACRPVVKLRGSVLRFFQYVPTGLAVL